MKNESEASVAATVPWPTTVAALIALATLVLVGRGGITVVIAAAFGIAILATYSRPFRIDNHTPMRWFLRVALIGCLYAVTRIGETRAADYLVGPLWIRNFFGLVFAGEMVIQAWRTRTDNSRAPLFMLFLSGFVFLTACNTFDDRFIRYITPVYMVTVALALRAYRRHDPDHVLPTYGAPPGPRGRMNAQVMASRAHWAALSVALLIGFSTYRVFQSYRGDITDWGNNLIGQRLEQLDTSGMSNQPMLGKTFGLRGSTERVLRLTGVSGNSGYTGDAHLRGMSFEDYEVGHWGPTVNDRPYAPPPDADLRVRRGPGDPPVGPTSIVRVTRLLRGNPLIYAPLNASEIDLTDAENLQWASDTAGPIRTTSPPPFTYVLTVPAREEFQGVQVKRITVAERQRCLAISSSINKQVITLAHSIVGKRRDPIAKIEAVVDYLITHHHYSLTTDPGPGDPISGFLLSDPPKDAHCEYFAASAAILLRCVGVPTRYVTGYYVHESDGSNASIVRQRDAHAWAEAWINGVGWVTVEATPGDGRPDFEPEAISKWQTFTEKIQDAIQAVRDWLGDLKPEQVNLMVGSLTGITVGGGAIWFFLRRKRGVAQIVPRFAYTIPHEELSALATRFEHELSRRGAPLPEYRTWQEHLTDSDTGRVGNDFLDLARRFVPLYERARFGVPRGDLALDILASLQQMLSAMEALPTPRPLAGRLPS